MTATTSMRSNPSVLWLVNIHFTMLTILATLLIGLGKHSSSLPLLVTSVSVLALVLTDYLGWIKINRTISYLGMLGGTAIALYYFWFDRQSNVYFGISNLHAVANMLVFIQIPLMFQEKDQRLFEHRGVFILLEFIVAALLNDNVLFGVMLIPSLAVGCSTLAVLAHFISSELSDKTSVPTQGFFAKFLNMVQWKRSDTSATNRIQMSNAATRVFSEKQVFWARSVVYGMLGSLLGVGILLFAIVYFFGLPRLHTGAFEGLGVNKPMVGFSERVTLDDVGELMLSNDLALRVSIQDSRSKRPFLPSEPPYIRGTVLDVYEGRGSWRTSNSGLQFSQILTRNQLREELNGGQNSHVVTVQEHARLGAVQFSMPPFFRDSNTTGLKFNPETWCLRTDPINGIQQPTKKRYQYETTAFLLNRQAPFLIDVQDCLQSTQANANDDPVTNRNEEFDFKRFPGLLELRDRVLAATPSVSLIDKALTLEDYLSTSSDFTYSLLPKFNRASNIDPIEDFAANHRTGHCQYFASALTIMLRSLGLKARIVIGFRPAEYNDLGSYFLVRQRHAHAWVEARFEGDHLPPNQLNIPSWATSGVWLRLDPTPQAEGSNAGGSLRNTSQSGQTLEAIEQLWNDSFMRFDNTSQSEAIGIFGASGDGFVASVLRSVERLALQLQSRTLGGESFSTENWFSWRGGVVASCLAIAGLFVFRFASRIRWRARRLNRFRASFDSNRYHRASWSLFRRMQHALARVGLIRQPYQTPLEFVEASQIWLAERGFVLASEENNLRVLIDAIYSMRYGSGHDLSPDEFKSFDATIRSLEKFTKQKPKLAP